MFTQTFFTPLYAAILGLVFVSLSMRTLKLRRKLQIAIGDAANEEMLRSMRVHSNFAEYAPITLLLIFMVEVMGAPTVLIHALGLSLLVGRLAHAYGVAKSPEDYRYRITGMAMTFTALMASALSLIVAYLSMLAGQ